MANSTELPSTSEGQPGPTLIAGRISTGQALFFGLSALGLPLILSSSGAYIIGGGNTAWLATLIAAAVALILSTVVVRFARKHVVSGSLMSYLRAELGPTAGIVGGSALSVGYAGAITGYLATVLYFGFGALYDMGLPKLSTAVELLVAAAVLALCCALQRRVVSVSVNVSIVLVFLCAPVVIVIMVSALLKSGVDLSPQLHLQGFTMAAFAPTVVIAFGNFVAFEGLTALAKETRNPLRSMPVVVTTLVAIMAVAALAAAILTVPILMAHGDLLSSGLSPLRVLADVGGVHWLGLPADLLMSIALIGSVIAYFNDSSRVVATAGQDGYLPRRLGKIHPRFHTPALSAQVMAVLGWSMLAVFLLTTDQGMYGATIDFTGFVVYSWCIAYIAILVAGVIAAARDRSVLTVVAYVAVIVFLAWLIIYQVMNSAGIFAVFTFLALGANVLLFLASTLNYRRGSRNAGDGIGTVSGSEA